MIKIPNNAIASVPLNIKSHGDAPDCVDPSKGSISLDDSNVASVALTSDGGWAAITPLVRNGRGKVTYSLEEHEIETSVEFEIVDSDPQSATFDEDNVVFALNPNPPQG